MASEHFTREVAAVIAASYSTGLVPDRTDEERAESELIGVALLADITILETERDRALAEVAALTARCERLRVATSLSVGDPPQVQYPMVAEVMAKLEPGDLDPPTGAGDQAGDGGQEGRG